MVDDVSSIQTGRQAKTTNRVSGGNLRHLAHASQLLLKQFMIRVSIAYYIFQTEEKSCWKSLMYSSHSSSKGL
jgi:hypothetical protein